MKMLIATAALVLCSAGLATAQDDGERKVEELRKAMKTLQQKFEAERARIEQELRAAQERLLEKKREDGKPRDLESLVKELIHRVDSLEKKLDGTLPPLRELPKMMPREFDFKRFDGVPDEWRRWLEQMPRFKGAEDFKFEFRKSEKKDEDRREDKKEKPKKKESDD